MDTLGVATLAVVVDARTALWLLVVVAALAVVVDARVALWLLVVVATFVDALCVVPLMVVVGRIAADVTGVGILLVAID